MLPTLREWLQAFFEVLTLVPMPWRLALLAAVGYVILAAIIHVAVLVLRGSASVLVYGFIDAVVWILGRIDLFLSEITMRLFATQWFGAGAVDAFLRTIDGWANSRRTTRPATPRRHQPWFRKRYALALATLVIAAWYAVPFLGSRLLGAYVTSAFSAYDLFEHWALRDSPAQPQTTAAISGGTGAGALATEPATLVPPTATRGRATVPPWTAVATTAPQVDVPALPRGLACPRSEACLTAPADGATVQGTMAIAGTATRPDFQYYKLEILAEGNAEWSFLGRGAVAVENGQLLTLETSQLPNGNYRLRLIVVDATGNYWPEVPEIAIAIGN